MPRYQEAIHVGSIKIDIVDNETRSRMMSSIKGKNTQPEILLRKYLHANGFRFRIHVAGLPGKPDIVLTKYKIAIFCDSEFFHGKDWEVLKPQLEKGKNADFWIEKISKNQQHDDDINKQPPDDIISFNELRSCADLLRMYTDNQLKIDPDFQRNLVWSAVEKTRFIDSLTKQLSIPSMCISLDGFVAQT